MHIPLNHMPTPNARRGSTLVIVIALLGLLAFTGMVFFSFASSERSAAEYFSEAAKGEVDEPDNVWDHGLRQIISGSGDRKSLQFSVLGGRTQRASLIANLVGADLAPHSGQPVTIIMEDDPATAAIVAVPRVDLDGDGTANDEDGSPGEPNTQDLLDFVDSPAARFNFVTGVVDELLPVQPPAPDVDYTYPDINNVFLAYRGWAIRDNGPSATPRYERVPVIIPSFFRPQYMKTGDNNGFSGQTTPTDIDWASSFDGTNRAPITAGGSTKFGGRSFRPHPTHVVVDRDTGAQTFRYLTDSEAAALGVTSGGFPFVPANNKATEPGGVGRPDDGGSGELGIWTGSNPLAYELDADNDGDGIREGIWLDLHFPVQESGTGKLYTVLHSFTIYDLDGLINLNVHGNLAGLDRSGLLSSIAGSGLLDQQFVSKSNLGLGPHEINPLWALRRTGSIPLTPHQSNQFSNHYGIAPDSNLEQANMEWIWLLSGRGDYAGATLKNILTGRWGETERLFNAVRPGGTRLVADLPRPGRPGDAQVSAGSGIGFGGGLMGPRRNGFDDNQDRYEGEIHPGLGRVRPFGTPMDFAGSGRSHRGFIGNHNGTVFDLTGGDIRLPVMHHDTNLFTPERFPGFPGYSLMRVGTSVDESLPRYVFGQNGVFDGGTGDDLISNIAFDPNFEDMLEQIFDADISDERFDATFGPQDLIELHADDDTFPGYELPEGVSKRLSTLAPYALAGTIDPFAFNEQTNPGVRSRFTTLSNTLHRFLMKSPFGGDGKPGIAGFDDNADGVIDNLADLTDPATTFVYAVPNPNAQGRSDVDQLNRAWEFSADTDGKDVDNDGFPDGDGAYEFPPAFGTTPVNGRPYSSTDPFRPQVRRVLTMESGENRSLVGQMPISPNHILDVERNAQTPQEGTREFLYYMQRAGLRFRPLTDHPLASEAQAETTAIPTWEPTAPVAFPPTTIVEREYWARRDRQKLARDIYVLLYTTGGASIGGSGRIENYTNANNPGDPASAEGSTLYTHEQLRRMAQFAVNLVDAMDSDNVMTKFEYDKNLDDGWNLDDDPYRITPESRPGVNEGTVSSHASVTGNGMYPEDGTVRGVVWGVEAQELTFSEVHGIHTENDLASDHQATPYPDNDEVPRDFLYVELQNMRPLAVDLAQESSTNEDTAVWRLARYDRDHGAGGHNAPVGAPGDANESIAILEHPQNVVDGGGRFSLSVVSDNNFASSAFFVDTGSNSGFDGTFELVAPDATGITLPTSQNESGSMDPGYDEPLTDIDLIHNDHDGTVGSPRAVMSGANFLQNLVTYDGNTPFETANGNAGTFRGEGTNPPLSLGPGFDLVLERRANPNMPSLDLVENPWVQVDRIRVTFDDFALAEGDPPLAIFDNVTNPMNPPTGHLMQLVSEEREEPLDDTDRTPARPKSATQYRNTTIKGSGSAVKSDLLGVNSANLPDTTEYASMNNAARGFELWQPHFDRDYASSGEFLSLPLVGPNLLTQRLNRMRYPGYQQSFPDPYNGSGTRSPGLVSTAEALFLSPDFTPNDTSDHFRDNRWYRLFQFVEVPSRVHRMLGNYLTLERFPGKLNVNTIRHREVLAGLFDNPYFADVPPLADGGASGEEDAPFLTSVANLGSRDLYHDFLKERDGRPVISFDPAVGSSKFYWIPGSVNARPFRSPGALGVQAAAENKLDHSLMRRSQFDRDEDNDGIEDELATSGDVPGFNRTWLELATPGFHARPGDSNLDGNETVSDISSNTAHQRHAMLSKVMNNTTTVSNCFIVFGTAAYFEVYEDPVTGLHRVGGRLDLDGSGNPENDQQRAVFVIDRTEAYKAFDAGTGDFDWRRLIKTQATID